jgi:DNA-binding PadR family transcriptional regulator
MGFELNKGDARILAFVAEYRLLTVTQLTAITQRSHQVIRRRLRTLRDEGLLDTRMRGYGRGPGRPEDFVFLTEKGNKTLDDKGVVHQALDKKNGNSIDPTLVDHDLLVNWFRIHLLQIERDLPELSTEFLAENTRRQAASGGKPVSLQERLPCPKGEKDWTEFIPDGVFCIMREHRHGCQAYTVDRYVSVMYWD